MARESTLVEVRFRCKPGAQQVDTTAISQVTRGPGVRRDLRRRAENVYAYQRANVGVDSGRLRATIRVLDRGLRGPGASIQVLVGRPGLTPYLDFHMRGTAPHIIRPKSPGGVLRFYWPKFPSHAYVSFKQVHHPGTKPNRFVFESTKYWRP